MMDAIFSVFSEWIDSNQLICSLIKTSPREMLNDEIERKKTRIIVLIIKSIILYLHLTNLISQNGNRKKEMMI
ncbi:hypothetical protein N134_05110 [Limosilactobacillus reuteri TD1]|uniref:Uncharacterized protein n=1 Tax=Limosilactobacillus reuteri TD1 TaxID=1358027 RepID=S5NY46_LIMRT|nr:hypothetical protein N134_05110 [Limosilactobacillus reuteri TD1]KEK16889.1 hypothetical protein HQ33_03585 [Limosilactobacillus reuteri]MCT3200064.1 hypothetical protein [Limosilactobacillus reuteri]